MGKTKSKKSTAAQGEGAMPSKCATSLKRTAPRTVGNTSDQSLKRLLSSLGQQKAEKSLAPVQSAQGSVAGLLQIMQQAMNVFESAETKAFLLQAAARNEWFMSDVGKVAASDFQSKLDGVMCLVSSCPSDMQISRPKLTVVHQPEKMVRSRYKSEGCRAPIKGLDAGSYPTVKVENYDGPVTIVAHLETVDGEIHPNTLIQSTACEDESRELRMPDYVDAIARQCDSNGVAMFDNLAVRRLNKDSVAKVRVKRECRYTKATANDDGIIVFRAYLPACTQPVDTIKSERFACVVPAEPAVIDLVHPDIGSSLGNDTLVLVGKKFKSGFTVTFTDGKRSFDGVVPELGDIIWSSDPALVLK